MNIFRGAVRILIVALVCALVTQWLGWRALPAVGFAYGVLDRNAHARGTIAALGAALGWTAILTLDAGRGGDVVAIATRLGAVLHVPALVFLLITLAFAAVLCGTAAVLGSAIGGTNASTSRTLHNTPVAR